MSKNHPNDNIYSILGKLDALKPTPAEERFALVKEIRESVEAQGSILTGVDAVQAKLAKQFAESQVTEKAVSKAQQKFMGMVHAAQKSGKAASPEVAKVAKSMGKKDAKDFASTKHKGLPAHVAEEYCEECAMGECSMHEGEITHPSKGVTRHTKTDFPGYPVDDINADDGEPRGRGRPRKHAKKEPTGLGRGRPKKAAPVGSTAPKMHDPFGRVAPSVKATGPKGRVHSLDEAMKLVQQNLTEGRYLEDSNKESFNHILNRFRAEVRSFEQGGDLDKDLYDALFDYYAECGEMPYGIQKGRDYDPMRWVAEKLDAELGDIAYGKDPANAEGAGLEMEAGIPGNLPPEQIPGKEDLLRGKGRSYYEEDALEEELNELARLAGVQTEGNAFSGKLAHTAKGDSFEQDGKTFTNRSSIADKELEEDDMEEGNAFGKAVADAKADGVQPGEKVEVGGKEIPVKESTNFDGDTSDFNISTSMSTNGDKNVTVTATGEHAASLLQMLRIAGLGGGETAQALQAQEPSCGDEEGFEPELVADEGNEFSGKLAQARAQHADSFEVDGKEYPVDEDSVDVDQPATEPANSPEPEYASMKGSTMGPGEGDAGEKAMNPDRPTKNNGDNALATPPTRAQKTLIQVAALESKLAAEYESIKKLS